MRSSMIGALPRPNAKLSAILLLAVGLALAGCETTETTAALPDTKPAGDSEVSNKAFQRAMENDWNGQQCREYQRTVTIDGKTETAYGTACRQPDGTCSAAFSGLAEKLVPDEEGRADGAAGVARGGLNPHVRRRGLRAAI